MTLIQIVLIVGFSASLLLYLSRLRNVLFDRLIALALFAAAVTSVIFPDITVKAAHILGVGRGTDLVLYLLATLSVFAIMLLYTKISRLSEQVTHLVRYIALKEGGPAGRTGK